MSKQQAYLAINNSERFYGQRLFKNNEGYQVKMPAGEEYFIGGKKQNFPAQVNQHQYRSEIHQNDQFNMSQQFENKRKSYQNKFYDRSLGISDIEGTQPGTLISKVVKNKELAQKFSNQHENQKNQLNQNQNTDSLDQFMRNSQYQSRQHYFQEQNSQDHQQKVNYHNKPKNQEQLYQNDAYYSQNDGQQQYQQQQQESGLSPQQKEIKRLKQQKEQFLAEQEEKLRQLEQQDQQEQRKNAEQDKEQQQERQRYEQYMKDKKQQEQQQQEYQNQKQQNQQQEQELDDLEREIQQLREQKLSEMQKKKDLLQNQGQNNENNDYSRLDQQQQDINNQSKTYFENKKYQQDQALKQNQDLSYSNLNRQQQQLQEFEKKQRKLELESQKQLVQTIQPHNFKLDINGYPVYPKKIRLNPTNFSYSGEELKGQSSSMPMSYGILDNQIVNRSNNNKSDLIQQKQYQYINNNNTDLNVKHFNKYPGELQIKEQERYYNKDISQPDMDTYKMQQEQKYSQVQALRQRDEELRHRQSLQQQYQVLDQYNKKTNQLEQQIQQQMQDKHEPVINYQSEYKQHYEPEKENPMKKFEDNPTREVYHPREHSKLNALASIPNEPHDTLETAKQITKRPSIDLHNNNSSNIQNLEQEKQILKKKMMSMGDSRFPDREEEAKLRAAEIQQFYEQEKQQKQQLQEVGGLKDGRYSQQLGDQIGQKNQEGYQFMAKDQFGGKQLKNISGIRIY